MPRADSAYYPVFLDLAGRRCVIAGGGRVAERKCSSLMSAGAEITIISPELTARLKKYKEKKLIKHLQRNYRSSDIKPAFLVIAATNSEETNRKIADDAKAFKKLLNVVDVPSLCSFIAPSVFRRGSLTIAISTGGASPALAKAIKKELEGLYGPEFSKILRILRDIRSKAIKEIPDKKERESFLKEIAARIFTN